MVLTTQNKENAPIQFTPKIELKYWKNYGYPSDVTNSFSTERIKISNLPLIIKRLEKLDVKQVRAVNLLDLLSHEDIYLNNTYDELIKLGTLEYLTLDASQINEKILQLTTLEGLIIVGKSVETLPDYLAQLPNLIWLDAGEIRLNKIPDCVFNMPILRGLKLKVKSVNAQLSSLFETLLNLEFLSIDNSGITTLPDTIKQLNKLRFLNLDKNKLVKLPPLFAELTQLETFIFSVNTKELAAKHSYFLPKQLSFLKIQEQENSLPFLSSCAEHITRLETSFDLLSNKKEELSAFINLKFVYFTWYYGGELSINLSNLASFPAIETLNIRSRDVATKGIGEITQLKTLIIDGNIKDGLEEIGDLINLENLELRLGYDSEFILPVSWNNLQNLQSLSFISNTINWKNIRHLKSIKRIEIKAKTLNFSNFIEKNTQIETLIVEGINEPLTSIFQLKKLKKLRSNLDVFGLKLPENIHEWAQLEDIQLFFHNCENMDYLSDFFKQLLQIKSLKRIHLFETDLQLPNDWTYLNQFPHIQVLIGMLNRTPVPEIALLSHAELVYVNNWASHIFEEQLAVFNSLKNYTLNPQNRLIVYGLITDNLEKLKPYLPNTLSDTLTKESVLYITGRPHGLTKAQMSQQLAVKEFKIAIKLNEATTHIVVGVGISIEEAVKVAGSGKQLILSEYITSMLNSPDDFFLLQTENKDLNQQIIPLFLSEETANHQIAVEMLKGGGVTKRILNYLFVCQGCHPNIELRKEARQLFRRFASPSLVEFAKGGGWDYLKGEPKMYHFRHEDLNYWDCVLAYQQYRNKIVDDRLRNSWTFSRDQPFTIFIDYENLNRFTDIPEELRLVNANGICLDHFYEKEDFFDYLLKIPKKYPQLKKNFHCMYGDITTPQYERLKKHFETVHLTNMFTVKDA
jgi:hypothetical protein